MPAKLRQQIRLTPDLAAKVRQLGELWGSAEGPLTPSAVFRVAVERAWEMEQRAWWNWPLEDETPASRD